MADCTEIQTRSALPGYDGIISKAEQALVVPVKFPYQPLEVISGYSVADLAAHGYPYAYGSKGRLRPEYDEIGGMDFVPLPGNPQEIRSFQEPLMPGEAGHLPFPTWKRW